MNDWISQETLLTEGYRHCAKLTWNYGTTYFWGAALLPKPQRKHVYAVYALCRLADDIVDLPNDQHTSSPEPNQMRAGPVAGLESGASTSSARISDLSTSSTHLRLRQAQPTFVPSPIPRSLSLTPSSLPRIETQQSVPASRSLPISSEAAWTQGAVPTPSWQR